MASVPAQLASVLGPQVQPYLISWMKYDPAKEIAKLEQPILVVQGTTDTQVDDGTLVSGVTSFVESLGGL